MKLTFKNGTHFTQILTLSRLPVETRKNRRFAFRNVKGFLRILIVSNCIAIYKRHLLFKQGNILKKQLHILICYKNNNSQIDNGTIIQLNLSLFARYFRLKTVSSFPVYEFNINPRKIMYAKMCF